MATNATHSAQQQQPYIAEGEKIPLTRGGYEQMAERLRFLTTERRLQIADYIHEAKEAGDVSESSAYEDAKNQQAMLEGEIQELQRTLEHAVIIEAPGQDGHKVAQLGTTLDIETDHGMERTFTLVSSAEASTGRDKLSDQSPVGRALLGHAEGDQVEVLTPGGKVVYTIRAIR